MKRFIAILLVILLLVGLVACEQKENAEPEPGRRGYERPFAHIGRLFYCGNDQAPHRRRDHNTGGKAGKGALCARPHAFFHKEHARRSE